MGRTALPFVVLAACGRLGFDHVSTTDASTTDAEATSLVGCWTFDEGTGTTAGDCSGNDNLGSLAGAAAWTAGEMNNAISLGGNLMDMVTVPPSTVFDFGTSSFSYGLWVKLENVVTPQYESPMWKGGSSTFYTGYDLEYDTVGMTWDVSLSDSVIVIPLHSPPHEYRDSMWHHVFVVVDRDASTHWLYVDGVAANSSSLGALGSLTNTYTLKFGYLQLAGSIDEARIYNRALSADEVAGLFASPGSR